MFHGIQLDLTGYSLVNVDITMEDHPFLTDPSSISTGPFSIAMLNYQRIYDWDMGVS